MRTITLAFVALAGCGARTDLGGRACVTRSITLAVTSQAPWVDTGIDLVAGDELVVSASGTVQYGGMSSQTTDANGGNFDGQKFFTTAVFPKAVIVSLIGKVGGSTSLDTGTPIPEGEAAGGPGFVGTSYDAVIPTTGRLFLGFNDQRQDFGDNRGAFTVTIRVRC